MVTDQDFISSLAESVDLMGLPPVSDSQLQKMAQHFGLLIKWNRRLNLTRITEPRDAARLHYAESVYGRSFLKGAASVLDVGSGAGFPGVPLAIVDSGLSVTALESNQKKYVFLKEVKDHLALPNFEVVNSRIQEYAWADFAALTSRALDRAESIYINLVSNLSSGQILVLYCSVPLFDTLSGSVPEGICMERHSVPLSQNRLIALFKRNTAAR